MLFFKDTPVEKLAPVLSLPVAWRHPGLISEMLNTSSFHEGQGVDRSFCDV